MIYTATTLCRLVTVRYQIPVSTGSERGKAHHGSRVKILIRAVTEHEFFALHAHLHVRTKCDRDF